MQTVRSIPITSSIEREHTNNNNINNNNYHSTIIQADIQHIGTFETHTLGFQSKLVVVEYFSFSPRVLLLSSFQNDESISFFRRGPWVFRFILFDFYDFRTRRLHHSPLPTILANIDYHHCHSYDYYCNFYYY